MKILSFASLLSKQTTKFIARHKNDEIFVVSPLNDDEFFLNFKQYSFVKYEIDTLGFVLALVCSKLLPDFMPIDEGYLSGESNVSEEEIASLCSFIQVCDGIIVSPENFNMSNANNIRFMLDLLCKKFNFSVIGIDGKIFDLCASNSLSFVEEGKDFNGASVFCLPSNEISLQGGEMFMMAAKLKENSVVKIQTNSGEINANFMLNKKLKGTTGLLFAPNLEYKFIKL